MLALLCLCCSHRNPADASFCNACGTPLHLKPCTHCDTINQRAAAHCRSCGEAFSFDFSAVDFDDRPDDEPPVTPSPPQSRLSASSGPRGASQLRASALGVAALAAVGFSAFYALRDPPQSLDGPNGASPRSAYLPTVSAAPVAAIAPERPAADGPPGLNLAKAAAGDRGAGSDLTDPGPQTRKKKPGATKSLTAARKPRPAPKVARSYAGTGATAAVASSSRAKARSPTCAEGVMMSAACDVRTLAKGN